MVVVVVLVLVLVLALLLVLLSVLVKRVEEEMVRRGDFFVDLGFCCLFLFSSSFPASLTKDPGKTPFFPSFSPFHQPFLFFKKTLIFSPVVEEGEKERK